MDKDKKSFDINESTLNVLDLFDTIKTSRKVKYLTIINLLNKHFQFIRQN